MLIFGQSVNEIRTLPIKNVGSQKVPPFGIVQVAGKEYSEAGGQWVIQVRRPTEDNAKLFMINGSTDLKVDHESEGSWDWPQWVLYDSSDGSPGLGEVWGVAQDSFKAKKGKRGLIIVPADSGDELQEAELTFAMLEYCRP